MPNLRDLTDLECAILRLRVEGLSYDQISDLLGVSASSARHAMVRVRDRLGATNNEQLVLMLAWHRPDLLAGCVARHGTAKALAWHEAHGVPLCGPCVDFQQGLDDLKSRKPVRYRKPPERRLRRGAPVEHGTMERARRHLRAGERIGDLTCGCREAYQQWWREYRRDRTRLGSEAA